MPAKEAPPVALTTGLISSNMAEDPGSPLSSPQYVVRSPRFGVIAL
jgi:hypothetical protein